MKRFCTLLLILLLSSATQAQGGDESERLDLESIKSEIQGIAEEYNLPSVSYTLVDDGGVLLMESLGQASLEESKPATVDSLYRIGSTSKMFVALSVLKLVEEGKLSLNDSVRSLVPEIEFSNQWEEEHPVRVVHLLEHTTGWDDSHLVEYAHSEEEPVSLKDGLNFHPHSRESRWVPGTRMAYTNSGPPVAAYIVEKITGQRFEDYVEEQFFEPLGMQNATFFQDATFEKHGVTLYDKSNKPEDYWHILFRPTGAINASIKDMAQLLKFYIGRGTVNGNQIISMSSLERMERPVSNPGAEVGLELGYGLNNYSANYERWHFREHGGAVNNGLCAFGYLPQAGAGYSVLINSGHGMAQKEISDLLKKYITQDLESPVVEKERELSDAQRDWEGHYVAINPRTQMSWGLHRLLAIFIVDFTEDKMHIEPMLGDWDAYHYPVTEKLFKSDYTGAMHVALVEDPLAGRVLHMESAVLEPVPAVLVYFRLAVAILWTIFVMSSLVYFVVWFILRLSKHPAANIKPTLHLMPLFASLSVLVFFVLNVIAVSNPIANLGAPGFYSIGMMLTSILFFVFSVLSVIAVVAAWRSGINRVLYTYFALAAILHIAVAVYLLRFDMIGIMTWA